VVNGQLNLRIMADYGDGQVESQADGLIVCLTAVITCMCQSAELEYWATTAKSTSWNTEAVESEKQPSTSTSVSAD